MTTVLFKALAFLIMIALGFFFKARGILKPDDSQTLMKIIINITLPMAMIAGFQSFSLDLSLAFAIALGFGFNECVKGFESMTKEELYEIGVNDAGNHTDFMIGSDDLSIDGVDEHGKVHPIFRSGTWAF